MVSSVRKRPQREVWLSSSTRPGSDRPPVSFPNGSHPNGSSPNGSSHAPDEGEGVVLPPVDEGRVD